MSSVSAAMSLLFVLLKFVTTLSEVSKPHLTSSVLMCFIRFSDVCLVFISIVLKRILCNLPLWSMIWHVNVMYDYFAKDFHASVVNAIWWMFFYLFSDSFFCRQHKELEQFSHSYTDNKVNGIDYHLTLYAP